eukprot:752985-Pyramimonas_sp.AAC.1
MWGIPPPGAFRPAPGWNKSPRGYLGRGAPPSLPPTVVWGALVTSNTQCNACASSALHIHHGQTTQAGQMRKGGDGGEGR